MEATDLLQYGSILIVFNFKKEDKNSEGRLAADIWKRTYFRVLQENRYRYHFCILIFLLEK